MESMFVQIRELRELIKFFKTIQVVHLSHKKRSFFCTIGFIYLVSDFVQHNINRVKRKKQTNDIEHVIIPASISTSGTSATFDWTSFCGSLWTMLSSVKGRGEKKL